MNRILLVCIVALASALVSAQSVKVESRSDSNGRQVTKYFIMKDGKWVETTAEELRKLGINISGNSDARTSGSGNTSSSKSGSANTSGGSKHSGSASGSSSGSSSHSSSSKHSSSSSSRDSGFQSNRDSRSSSQTNRSSDSQSVQKLIQSISRQQVFKHDRQGYLTPEDLTPEQRKLIDLPTGGSWHITYRVGGKTLVLKSR